VAVIARRFQLVIAGLDPAIHLPRKELLRRLMDARIKFGYDTVKAFRYTLTASSVGTRSL
jgi:hypothetical protein